MLSHLLTNWCGVRWMVAFGILLLLECVVGRRGREDEVQVFVEGRWGRAIGLGAEERREVLVGAGDEDEVVLRPIVLGRGAHLRSPRAHVAVSVNITRYGG